jgi:hypothetical protein
MILCANCERANAPRARFCGGCGAALGSFSVDGVTPSASTETRLNGESSRVEIGAGAAERAGEGRVAVLERDQVSERNSVLEEAQFGTGAPVQDFGSACVQERERSQPACGGEAKMKEGTTQKATGEGAPLVVLECNWHRLLVVGHGTTLELRLSNRGVQPCSSLCVELRSRALAEPVAWRHQGLKPGQSVEALLELDAFKSGVSVLQVNVWYETPAETVRLVGRTGMTVHVAPSESNLTVSVGNIFSELREGAGTGAELNIETLVDIGKIRTVNDLIAMVLPDRFVRVPLEPEISEAAVRWNLPEKPALLRQKIPTRYASYVKQAARMELVPVRDACSDGGAEPSILLVAADTFRIGRQRGEVDYLAWFWPRSLQNDERTMRLSKGVHLSLRLSDGAVYLEDPHSANGSTFRGTRVPRNCETGNDLPGLPVTANGGRLRLDGPGIAALAGEYELELMPMASSLGAPLSIVNESVWPGGHLEAKGKPPFGCIRLDPLNSAVALQRSIWILSDVSFGAAVTNGLVLTDGQTPEVQGRFIYHRAQFWIESLAEKDGVQVDGLAMELGELIPLVERQTVRIGGRDYRTHFPAPPER